jgi:transcriptional regulator with XRE-family HTH domain
MGTIERGESNLSFQNLVKVSNALGMTLSQLLSGVEKRAAEGAQNEPPKRRTRRFRRPGKKKPDPGDAQRD